MSNISTFVSSFTTEVSRPCNFEVTFPVLPFAAAGMDRELRLRCEATDLPGRTFAMAEQKTYGPVQRFPIQNAYDNIQLTFICSDNMAEKVFFDDWMNYISQSQPAAANFDFKYKDSYSCDITIAQKDLQNITSYAVNLVEAYPFAVNPVPLNWRDVDNYNRLNVNFNFRYSIVTVKR